MEVGLAPLGDAEALLDPLCSGGAQAMARNPSAMTAVLVGRVKVFELRGTSWWGIIDKNGPRPLGRPHDHPVVPGRDRGYSAGLAGQRATSHPTLTRARNQFALRQAMLRYRSIFTQSIGRRPPEPDAPEARRREMA